MNIFYINEDPIVAARELLDDHVRKMQIESAQMLCFAHYAYGNQPPYKNSKPHFNHPCSKWIRQSIQHYIWLLEHGLAICDEFELRYGKEHATKKVLIWLKENKPPIPDNGFKDPPKCMDENFKKDDTVKSYHNFYIKDKIKVKGLDWKKIPSRKPQWVINE
jgi:hypothetical protein